AYAGADPVHLCEKTGAGDTFTRRFAVIPERVLAQAEAFCTENRVTMGQFFAAATAVFLKKQAGFPGQNVFLNSVIHNRFTATELKTPGMFVNTYPIEYRLNDGESFLENVRANAMAVMGAYRHQACTFDEVMDAVRAKGGHPAELADVSFNYLVQSLSVPYRFLKWYPTVSQTGSVSIALTELMRNGEMALIFDYNVDKFSAEEIDRLMGRYIHLIGELARAEGPVAQVSLLTDEERRQVLVEFNDTRREFDKKRTIVEQFEETAARRRDQTAVICADRTATYGEINAMANRIASALREEGIGPDDFVAMLTEKSPEMIAGIFGILKAGGAYVPIDPSYPEDRKAYILNDCRPRAVLTFGAETDAPIAAFNLADARFREGDAPNPAHVNKTSDLAYCIYTSGTTGLPKGVMVEHRALNNLVHAYTKVFGLTEEDCVLQAANYAFDQSVWDIFNILLVGGRLALASRDMLLNPRMLGEYCQKNRVTAMSLTPAVINELDADLFESVRVLETGAGEANPGVLKRWHKPGRTILNTYGPTEYCVNATTYICPEELPVNVPIGKPMDNTCLYVLKGAELCGVGMIGELCIAGDSIARGYLNNDRLNTEKFVDNPFGGGRMYRTGDLAMWDGEGNILFMGRIDEQVKIRGYRIELGEIDSALRALDGVKDCAVIAREDKTGDKAICAYVVGDGVLDAAEIRGRLRRTLPEYMVPAYLLQIDRIPQTRNGKVDKRALPDILDSVKKEYVAPRSETEKAVCRIFGEILDVDNVSVTDDFFDLGGHSLRATRMANQIEEATGCRLELKQIFADPTPAGLARLIEASQAKEYEPIPRAAEAEYYPMSSSQKRTYLVCQMEEDSIAYNMPGGLTITGDVDPERIRDCMQRMIDRHEILRTAFLTVNGEPVQKVCTGVRADFECDMDETADEQALLSGFIRPFDLSRPSQIRMHLQKRRGGWLLLLDMHHIISDGMSVNIFVNEFSALYNGRTLAPLTHQYKDYSEWMNGRDLSGQEKFWLDQFPGEVPVLDLPLDYPRPQKQSYQGGKVVRALGKAADGAVRSLAARYSLTEYMVFLAAAMVLLGRYSRQEDVVIGSAISGRTHQDTEGMMGMFVNSLAMRGRPEKGKKFSAFLAEIKALCLAAYANQEYPFEQLVEKADVIRDFSRNPIFDVMLAVQNNEEVALDLGGAQIRTAEYDEDLAKFDLTFTLEAKEGAYTLNLGYCTALFKQETVEYMAEHFVRLLENAAEEPDTDIGRLCMFSEEEADLVVHKFNSLHVDYDPQDTVVRLFENAVRTWPDRRAVVFGEQFMTYDQLNRKANQLARTLRSLGVGANDFVAIFSSRCLEVVVAIYGILKAGGAYMPIDPKYPRDRIEYMLKDASPKAVLTARGQLPEGMEANVPVIDLTDPAVFTGEDENLGIQGSVTDLAYCIYTSGTTGRPKGTMIPQTGIVRLVRQCDYAVLDEDTVIIQTGQLAFDASTFEIFGTTLNGGKLCLPEGDELLDGDSVIRMAKANGVNVMFITTALFNYFTDNYLELFSGFRTVLTGGEKISIQHVEKFRAAYPEIDLKNVYGPTENTTFTTKYPIREIDGEIPIGCPVNNTQLYVMDRDELCGIGMPGELCMAGDGLALGYLNNPEMTESKFVPNPFGPGKMYRSGDLAMWNRNGDIVFIGRVDEQVKIRGFRIEPAEIDNAIRKLDGIINCAVIVRKDKGGSLAVFAYLVSDRKLDINAVRSELAVSLPEYMLPSYMMQIDTILVTGNGKVDKRKLPEIEGQITGEYIPPTTETEKLICGIFARILSLEKVGIRDNFFEIGGHSLRATRLVNEIEASTGCKLALREVFVHSTPEQLAERVDEMSAQTYEPIPVAEKKAYYPMSSTQKRTYLVVQMDEGGLSYNMPAAFRLHGEVDPEWMRHAMQDLVDRHEILRTRFITVDGEPMQEICEQVPARFEYIVQEKASETQLLSEFVRPFDVLEPSQLRMCLVRRGEGEYLLMVDIHHIISDGFSVNILIREFAALYNGDELPPLKVQYKDYSEWMRTRDFSA
ncbi:MAG: amino acid adenylation domain-containing protein, partial [Clostridia bacterium]|nr:amino acid adenylation domain-containing protein [Clostridia bacterium]